MPGDNIYPDLSNSQFDIQYARLMGLPSDLRATLGVVEESGGPSTTIIYQTPSDDDPGQFRFGVAGEDNLAAQHRAFDLAGAYKFEITQLGNTQFLVDPTNGLYQLGAVPVVGSDSILSYTYLEIDDTTRKITLQAAEGIVLPGYGVGVHPGTAAFNLAVDAGGNLIEVASGSAETDPLSWHLTGVSNLTGDVEIAGQSGEDLQIHTIGNLSVYNGNGLGAHAGLIANFVNEAMLEATDFTSSGNAAQVIVHTSQIAGDGALVGLYAFSSTATEQHGLEVSEDSISLMNDFGSEVLNLNFLNLPLGTTSNVLYYDNTTGKITYGTGPVILHASYPNVLNVAATETTLFLYTITESSTPAVGTQYYIKLITSNPTVNESRTYRLYIAGVLRSTITHTIQDPLDHTTHIVVQDADDVHCYFFGHRLDALQGTSNNGITSINWATGIEIKMTVEEATGDVVKMNHALVLKYPAT